MLHAQSLVCGVCHHKLIISCFFFFCIAPPVENPAMTDTATPSLLPSWSVSHEMLVDEDEPRKKKYAKESWPGKKPTHLLA